MWVNMVDKLLFRVGTVALILMKFSFSVYLIIHRCYFLGLLGLDRRK